MVPSPDPRIVRALNELSALAERQGGVVTRWQCLAAGLTAAEVMTRIRRGEWERVRPGVFQLPGTAVLVGDLRLEEQLNLAAALLRHPGSVVSHESASRVWRLPLVGRDRRRGTVSRGGTRPRTPDSACHGRVLVSRMPVHHVATVAGWLRVTSPARTIADLARTRGERCGIAAADHALREKLCVREDLMQVVKDCNLFPAIDRAVNVAHLASGLAASPLESISRYELLTGGLALVEEQVVILDPGGEFVARVDFVVDGVVVGEADGFGKYASREDLVAEKIREDRLRELGYEVVCWTWDEVYRAPSVVLAKFTAALARARVRRTVAS